MIEPELLDLYLSGLYFWIAVPVIMGLLYLLILRR